MPDTLDDWLERWPTRKGPATEAEVQRLVDEIKRLRSKLVGWEQRNHATVYERTAWLHDIGKHDGSRLPVMFCPRCEIEHPLGRLGVLQGLLDHALTLWLPRSKENLAEWDDTDWADSAWSPAEQRELRDALARLAATDA